MVAFLQAFERLFCRQLAGGFLAVGAADGCKLGFVAGIEHDHLHGKTFAMGGSDLADHLITRLGASAGPQQLLQAGFVVGYEEHLAAGAGEPIQLRFQNMGKHKGARHEESAIQIEAARRASTASASRAVLRRPPVFSSPRPSLR